MRFVLALAFAAPLFAQNCVYVATPSSFSISAATTPAAFTVTQTQGSVCGPYIATTQTVWLHINDPSGGVPGTSVTFTADANPGATQRIGLIVISGQLNVYVTQAGATCNFGMTPTSQNFPVGGGNGVANIQAGCSWQASTSVTWIAFNGVAIGTQNGTVNYSVAANTCVAGRSGTITLQTGLASPPALAVTQDGAPGNLTLSPASITAAAAASDGRITVSTGDGCNWSATADVSWIQITYGSPGTGSGGISYHLLANTSAQRTGNIHVGTLTCIITQQAPGPPPAVLSSVANAANYNTDAVSPGEIVALFGSGLGPASIVTLQVSNGVVTNTLAGTQVLFDSVAAPMIYTLSGQVSAVVPYGVAGKTSTQVQVSYQGSLSNTVTMPVRAATPAIFSLDASGVGPGAILNQDLSVNSTGNPAARLSVIALYCTGGGVTQPPSTDGAVIAGASFLLAQTPVVTIGGVNAVVQYAGAAPGSVAGLTQINVQVPAGVTPANALPVIVKIGDFASTASVTVAVK
ncbi:MAG: BACON domain-containing carbohydrate-binding protein [Candidatus Solibacter sp.]